MIAFVILHYQAIEETINCVNSILNNVDGEKKIVVVDNASPNKSGYDLKNKYASNGDVTVLFSTENVGFAKGNNIGYQYARKLEDIEFIVVMNNDMIIEQSSFIQKIYDIQQETNFDILGPDIYSVKYQYHQNPQASKNISYQQLKKKRNILRLKKIATPLYFVRWKIFGKVLKKKKLDFSSKKFIEKTVFNQPLHGSCYIFSSRFIRKNNLCFDEGTFMYLESYILFYHAQRRGEIVVYDPRIRLLHLEDVATDKVVKNYYRKAIFSNQNLLNSTNYFIKLIEKDLK